MTSHLSERFHDRESSQVYLELLQSSLDRPLGSEQSWLLDRLPTPAPRAAVAATTKATRRAMPHLSLRWFTLPRLPLPFLTWAS